MSESPRHLSASHGWSWVIAAAHMLRRWPGVFFPMGLIVAAIQFVPVLGGLALLIVGPALVAGSVTAAHTADTGGTPIVRQLFAMFQDRTRSGESLKLCLPLLAGKILAVAVVAIALRRHIGAAGIDVHAVETNPEQILALFATGNMPWWLALGVVIVLVAWTFAVLAIPCVALGHERAFTAMGRSARQVWRNLAPWIVVLIVLFMGIVALTMLLMFTRWLVIVQMGLYTALYAFLGPLLHAAWRDLDGSASRPTATRGDGPVPPSGTLEA